MRNIEFFQIPRYFLFMKFDNKFEFLFFPVTDAHEKASVITEEGSFASATVTKQQTVHASKSYEKTY